MLEQEKKESVGLQERMKEIKESSEMWDLAE